MVGQNKQIKACEAYRSGGREGHINMQTMEMLGYGQDTACTVKKEVRIS